MLRRTAYDGRNPNAEIWNTAMLQPLTISKAYAEHLKIGTCSWKYESWQGVVYDPDKRYSPLHYLPDSLCVRMGETVPCQ